MYQTQPQTAPNNPAWIEYYRSPAKLEPTEMMDSPPRKPESEETSDAEHLDEELDEALEESFPASDPPAVGGSD